MKRACSLCSSSFVSCRYETPGNLQVTGFRTGVSVLVYFFVMMILKRPLFLFLLWSSGALSTQQMAAQEIEQTVKKRLTDYFAGYVAQDAETNRCRLDSVTTDFNRRQVTIYVSEEFAYQPIRNDKVEQIYTQLRQLLPGPVNYFQINLRTGGRAVEELIPNYYRKSARQRDKQRLYTSIKERKQAPWVSPLSRPFEISKGLQNRHLSLWQSHGNYFVNRENQWAWQRPRLFCTTEDLFTQSFVLPYLIPMLEHAGAVVFTPRERDPQRYEVIVDNDTSLGGNGRRNAPNTKIQLSASQDYTSFNSSSAITSAVQAFRAGMQAADGSLRASVNSRYIEQNSRKSHWQSVNVPGFGLHRSSYHDGENPFMEGTVRVAPTEAKAERAFAEWIPDLPESGEYAVYVSYRSLPESVSDAKYLVFHSGGVSEFRVNQQIGGGTWVYLGTFRFDKGSNDYCMVVLSNESREKGVVCADAVRFGGGMGHVERNGKRSGLPRYLEGARYQALWSGMDEEVYNGYQSNNDYNDDINVRSRVLNFLNRGSAYNPQDRDDVLSPRVPFELNMALHSDAGYHSDDRIVGSLGIYTTRFNEGVLAAGTDRMASRDLTDLLMSQIVSDLQGNFGVTWNRRSMWDRNYSETRLPSVASCIIELLSHQNFADMQWGHDPVFKFTVSRALYKGLLRFSCMQHQTDYVVQPLPVTHFALQFGKKKNTVTLQWRAQDDPQEPTAKAEEYVVYTRIGRGGFDNGVRVNGTSYTMKLEPGVVYSFKVTAVNDGGESFPSEILSAYKSRHEQKKILIINGFDRLSGPAVVNTPLEAGFDLQRDPGIPYLRNLSLCGYQQVFDRQKAGKQLGESDASLEGLQMAGNSFDYPFVHGKAIQAAGHYSFVSCSDEAVEDQMLPLYEFDAVDYILGAEKLDGFSATSRGMSGSRDYTTFSSAMVRALTAYLTVGGKLMVSGAYVASDSGQGPEGKQFVNQWLRSGFAGSEQTREPMYSVSGMAHQAQLHRLPNEAIYPLPSPDALLPLNGGFAPLSYADGKAAAVAFRGNEYRTFTLGFPLECVTDPQIRQVWMASILNFLTE